MDNVKKLLSCNRRQITAGDDASSCSSVKSEVRDSSSDSLLCQPRLTLEELRRRQMERHAEIDSRKGTDDDTESERTLCTGSFIVEDIELLVDSMMQQEISVEEKFADPDAVRQACNSSAGDRQKSVRKPDNLAEICHLESCDDSCNVNPADHEVFLVSHPGELTVTEYYPSESPAFDQKQKVFNNAPLCYQGQLKAEQCEISFRQGDNATVCSSEMGLQLTANLSDTAMFQSSCSNTSRLNACHWSALRIQLVPNNESEPRNTCATLTTSEDPRSHLTCRPTGDSACPTGGADVHDADSVAELAITPSVVDAGSVAAAEATVTREEDHYQLSLKPEDTAGISAQTNMHVGHSQLDLNYLPALESSKDRFGIMSAELYLHLLDGARGPDLMRRYLEKREVSETVRVRHEQRCGRISDKTVQAILKSSAEAAATGAGAIDDPATKTHPACSRPAPDPADAAAVPAAMVWPVRPSDIPKLGGGPQVNFHAAQRKVRLAEDERHLKSKSQQVHRKPRTA